jgi:hypothetical protein
MSNSTSTLPTYVINAIAAGYTFECPCGELLRSIVAARTCRKCRKYSYFPGRYVINRETDELVYGTLPTDEEIKEAYARAEAREAAEAAYWAELEAKEAAEAAAAEAARVEEVYWTSFFKWDTEAESLGF